MENVALPAQAWLPLPSGKHPAHQCLEMVKTVTGMSEANIHFLFSNWEETGDSIHTIQVPNGL